MTFLPSFLKDQNEKVLTKRLAILLLVLALSGLGIYGSYKLPRRTKAERRELKSRKPHSETSRRGESTAQTAPAHQATRCTDLHEIFCTLFNDLFEEKVDDANDVIRAYQLAKQACAGLELEAYYARELPELAREKYEASRAEIAAMTMARFREYGPYTLRISMKARSDLDDAFEETRESRDVLCEYYRAEMTKELQAKDNCARTEDMWMRACFVCPDNSQPTFERVSFQKFMFNQLHDSFHNLPAIPLPDQEAAKTDLLGLLDFWRSFRFGSEVEDAYYASISDMASLDEFLKTDLELREACQPFNEALNACVAKLGSIDDDNDDDNDDDYGDVSPLELEALEEALTNIKPHVTLHKYPAFADKEVQHAYQIVQRTIESNGSAERVLFEYYDDIIRSSVLYPEDNVWIANRKVQHVYDMVRAKFTTMAQECYGDLEHIFYSDDAKLSECNRNFTNWQNRQMEYPVKTYKQVLTSGKFHIFQFDQKMRDMLLWMHEQDDYETSSRIMKDLDYECKVSKKLEPFVTAFSEYAHARQNYIHKEFTDQDESNAEYDRLERLLRTTCEQEGRPDNFETLYKLPNRAFAFQVPAICSTADAEFNEKISYYFKHPYRTVLENAYKNAAETCTPFETFTRMGIDGAQVSFDQFYAGTIDNFIQRVLQYAAEKLKDVPEDQREYTCHLGSLIKLKPEIDELITQLNQNST